MYGNEERESPMVFFEAMKVMETLESSENKLFQQKNVLEQKQAYYEQLEQNIHNEDESKSNASKRYQLTFLNSRDQRTDMQNTNCRAMSKQLCDSGTEAHQCIKDIELEFKECEIKTENLGNKLNDDTTQYEKKIDELIKLLDQLAEKRNKKLKFLEIKEKEALGEKIDLGKQISDYEIKEDGDDSELETLENELKELQSKLSVLNDEQSDLNRDYKYCDNAYEEVSEKCHESEFKKLENRFIEVNNEMSQLTQNLEIQQRTESELSNSTITLEDCETKLSEEIQQTSKFLDDLDQNPYGRFSTIEQEMNKIKADIAERYEKYADVESSGVKCSEQIKQQDEEIGATSSLINQLSSELEEMENAYDNLKTSTFFSDQYDIMTKDIDNMCKEEEKLNEDAVKTESEIEKIITQINKAKDKGELELLAIENNNLMAVKIIEKDRARTEYTNLKKTTECVENEIKELEELKKTINEKEKAIETQEQHITDEIEGAEKMYKIFKTKRHDLQANLGIVSAPPPICVQANDQKFTMSKMNGISKKFAQKPSKVVKRNWDSDSSMECEVIKFSDVLEKKYRKRAARENRK